MTHSEYALVADIMRVWTHSYVYVRDPDERGQFTRFYPHEVPYSVLVHDWTFKGDLDRLRLIRHSMVMDAMGQFAYYNRPGGPQRLNLSAFTRPMPHWKAVDRMASMRIERFVAYKFQVPPRTAKAILAYTPRNDLLPQYLAPPMSTQEANHRYGNGERIHTMYERLVEDIENIVAYNYRFRVTLRYPDGYELRIGQNADWYNIIARQQNCIVYHHDRFRVLASMARSHLLLGLRLEDVLDISAFPRALHKRAQHRMEYLMTAPKFVAYKLNVPESWGRVISRFRSTMYTPGLQPTLGATFTTAQVFEQARQEKLPVSAAILRCTGGLTAPGPITEDLVALYKSSPIIAPVIDMAMELGLIPTEEA